MSQVETHQFSDGGEIPNNPRLPLLIYKAAVAARGEEAAKLIEALYAKNDWRAAWRYGVYLFPHYHSTAHEVLGVYRGHARRSDWQTLPGVAKNGKGELLDKLLERLPFSLTRSQSEVIAEIRRDLATPKRMNRLLQGDVGSGKTLVALAAMISRCSSAPSNFSRPKMSRLSSTF